MRQHGTAKTCPHDASEHVHLSGTKVREKLRNGESLPTKFSRPKVVSLNQRVKTKLIRRI